MDPMKETHTTYATSRWTIGRARTLGRFALCASVAWIAACGSDSTTQPGGTSPPPPTSPVGTYNISTVNGKSLPVAIFSEVNYTYEVTTGSIGLTSDGKYSLVTTYRQTIPGNVETFVDSSGGTWTLAGTTVSLKDGADGSTGSLTWASTTLSFAIIDGQVTNTFVYTKK
jgi:hypothetical protein